MALLAQSHKTAFLGGLGVQRGFTPFASVKASLKATEWILRGVFNYACLYQITQKNGSKILKPPPQHFTHGSECTVVSVQLVVSQNLLTQRYAILRNSTVQNGDTPF